MCGVVRVSVAMGALGPGVPMGRPPPLTLRRLCVVRGLDAKGLGRRSGIATYRAADRPGLAIVGVRDVDRARAGPL